MDELEKSPLKKARDQAEQPTDYVELLIEVKERIRSAQYTALRAVNRELVGLYWDIGRMIAERQKKRKVGENLSCNSSQQICRLSFPA